MYGLVKLKSGGAKDCIIVRQPQKGYTLSQDLGRLPVEPKTGQEELHADGEGLGANLLSFWRWSTSDLVSNVTRGRLAEFIVAKALGISTDGVRNEWDAYDLETEDGVKIEVKSAAYLQSWHQERLSRITFRVPKTRSWDPDSNRLENEAKRPADVYVFAVLAHQDKSTVDPLNVNQWRFYVLPTRILDERTRSQHSITLKTLERLSSGSVLFQELRITVQKAFKQQGKRTA